MKTLILLVAAAMTAGMAAASDQQERHVRVFFVQPYGHADTVFTGDTVPFQQLNTLLFLEEPCPLKIVGASNMRRAWMALVGSDQVGCWYRTLNGYYVVIDGAGEVHRFEAFWESLPRARLNPDGSVTITEPRYDSRTFTAEVNNAKISQAIERMHKGAERP